MGAKKQPFRHKDFELNEWLRRLEGPDRRESLLQALRQLVVQNGNFGEAVYALAKHRGGDFVVRQVILELAGPQPPVQVSVKDFPGHTYDRAMIARGIAIESLRILRNYPYECVPILADALDTFVEYDPDMMYAGGASLRVCRVLEAFGPGAALALPKLVDRLYGVDVDEAAVIINVLIAMGAKARDALPDLELLRQRWSRLIPGSTVKLDVENSELDKLIASLRDEL